MTNRIPAIRFVVVALAVTWLFAVTFSYYLVHKPFTGENVLAILNALGDVAAAGALLVLATAVGRRLTRAFAFASPLEAIVLQTGLGLGLLAFVTLALGLGGLLNSVLFWLLLLIALFLLRDDVRSAWRDLRAIRLPLASRFERGLALFSALSLGLAFLVALTPPIGWDAIQYHLMIPKLAIAQGRIAPPPDNVSLSYPGLVEMLFLAAMRLKSDIAAQLMHFSYLLLTGGLVLAFAQRYFTTRVGWLAVALLVAAPSFLLVSTWAYNDLALVFYGVAALVLTLRANQENDWRANALAGVFAGLALGEKYTAGFVPLVLAVLMLRPQRGALVKTFVFLAAAGIVAAPWFLRNWALTGNPVYPFVFGGMYWDSFRSAWYSRFGTGLMDQPLALLMAPWDATIFGREDGLNYQATIGPLLLALLPFALLTLPFKREQANPPTRAMWVFVAVLYATWLLGVAQSKLLSQTRLLFPIFPIVAILAADAFERTAALTLPQFSLHRFTTLLIGLVLTLTAASNTLSFFSDRPLDYLLGYETRDQYLARHLGDYYTVARFVNTSLPAGARILFLWETRAYYVQRSVEADAILDRWPHLQWQFRNADAIAFELRRAGYTHVLLNRGGLDYLLQTGYDPITSDDLTALQDLVADHLKPVYGSTPFLIVTRNGKPAVLDADKQPYAVYALVAEVAK
ncbi:MAG: glycosyltransferase family 39 protein [Chloroflexi bacterium]|nr:glycosyltransferase family 39 protein [Chloroflexota bacterium]